MTRDNALVAALGFSMLLVMSANHGAAATTHGVERIAREIASRFTWNAMSIAFICSDDPTAAECDDSSDKSYP